MMERQNASRIDALLRALANRKLSPQARKVLGSYFDDVEYAWRILMRIADTPDALAVLGSLLEQLLVALSHAPDGNVALVNFERLTNSAHSKLQFLRRFYYDPAGLDALIQLLGVSNYAADTLCLHPEYLNMLLPTSQLRKPKGVDLLVREAIQAVQPFREARHKWESLRRFRRRETLRIIAGDVLGLLSYDAIVAELSALADAVLHSALQVALMEAGIRAPMGECGFLILALGKLGGQELNYSSDVDLMFIYDPDALAVHLSDTDGRRLRWHEPHKAVQDVAERIARALVHGLSDVTHHGRAYRVDMRLRPYGVHGPLVLTWQATMTYYESWAKAWERMALIKARPVAGDVPLAHRVMRFFDGIVYESPLEASAIEAIHDIKLRSEALLREAGRDDAHVKAGPGGIRDVEFTVQLLQLLGGAQFPEVRVGNTVDALAALVACGMLTDVEATQLRESYIFLRVLEHRLQIVDHLPLREMPRDTDQLEKLAHRMGYKRTDELSAAMHLMRDYQMHTQRVRLLHRRVFAEVLAGGQPIPVEAIEIYDLLERPLDNDVVQWLKQFGFERISMAQQRLRLLTYGPADVSLPWRERVMVLRALPTVLRAIAKSPSPDVALHRFEQLVSAVGNRATFISSVCSNEEALQALIRCMALSELLTELMMRYPEHIEIVLREPIPSMDAFAQVASDLLRSMHHIASIEDAKRTIRRFRHREVLRVGFGEIATILDATNASQRLAYIADACLQAALKFCGRNEGSMVTQSNRIDDVAIIGLGGLGAGELHYASDLDIIATHADDADHAQVERVISSTMKMLSDLTEDGIAYKVDIRLRPGGVAGALAYSLSSWCDVLGNLEAWHGLALPRARCAAGDKGLGEVFVRRTWDALVNEFQSERCVGELLHLWKRIRDEHAPSPGVIDPKHTLGGLADIQFGATLLQLKHANQHEELRMSNYIQAITTAVNLGLISQSSAKEILQAYVIARRVKNAITLLKSPPITRVAITDDVFPLLAMMITGCHDADTATQKFHDRWRKAMESSHAVIESMCQKCLGGSSLCHFEK